MLKTLFLGALLLSFNLFADPTLDLNDDEMMEHSVSSVLENVLATIQDISLLENDIDACTCDEEEENCMAPEEPKELTNLEKVNIRLDCQLVKKRVLHFYKELVVAKINLQNIRKPKKGPITIIRGNGKQNKFHPITLTASDITNKYQHAGRKLKRLQDLLKRIKAATPPAKTSNAKPIKGVLLYQIPMALLEAQYEEFGNDVKEMNLLAKSIVENDTKFEKDLEKVKNLLSDAIEMLNKLTGSEPFTRQDYNDTMKFIKEKVEKPVNNTLDLSRKTAAQVERFLKDVKLLEALLDEFIEEVQKYLPASG